MQNTYREIKKIVREQNLSREQIVHTLVATVVASCCDECAEKMRTEEFLNSVRQLARELLVCAELSKKSGAA